MTPHLLAAARVVRVFRGLAADESDGEFALWSQEDLIAAIVALDESLNSGGYQPDRVEVHTYADENKIRRIVKDELKQVLRQSARRP